MPKETIASCYSNFSNEEKFEAPFYLQIIWGRENGVQVATTNPDAPIGSIENGLYVDLGRAEINHAIRVLRRARDQAFGRDE